MAKKNTMLTPQAQRNADGFAVEVDNDPIAHYRISDMTTGEPAYFGFTDPGGAWYIMRKSGTSFRYARGDSDYPVAWATRASLTYLMYAEVF